MLEHKIRDLLNIKLLCVVACLCTVTASIKPDPWVFDEGSLLFLRVLLRGYRCTAALWPPILTCGGNCNLFAAKVICHKLWSPEVLVPATRTLWATIQSVTSSSFSSFKHPVRHSHNHFLHVRSIRICLRQKYYVAKIYKGFTR